MRGDLAGANRRDFSGRDIEILTTCYYKFSEVVDNLDGVYKLPKDFYESYQYNKAMLFSSQGWLTIKITVDKDMSEIIAVKEELCAIFEPIRHGISISIISEDGIRATFHKGGAVLNSDSGLSQDLR